MSEWTPAAEPTRPMTGTEPEPEHGTTYGTQTGSGPVENDTVKLGTTRNDTMEIGTETSAPASTSAAVTTPGPVTAPVPEAAPPPARRGVRIGTIVFGTVMLVISVVCLLALATSVNVDGSAIGLALLLGAGAALVAGGAASAVREARGGPGAAR
jgi:hypothetical protein